jgi:hypothetical protein
MIPSPLLLLTLAPLKLLLSPPANIAALPLPKSLLFTPLHAVICYCL